MGSSRSFAQQFHYVGLTELNCKFERSIVEAGLRPDVGTFVEEKLHHTRLA